MVDCRFTTDDDNIAHNSAWQTRTQPTMWTSDPKHQLVCLVLSRRMPRSNLDSSFFIIISIKMFFDLDISEGMAAPITWENWGPSNTRHFLVPASSGGLCNRESGLIPFCGPWSRYNSIKPCQ
jgi:hypothetical protein